MTCESLGPKRRGASAASFAVLLVAIAATGVSFLVLLPRPLTNSTSISSSSTTSMPSTSEIYVIVDNPSPYLHGGYSSQRVNFSVMRNGDTLTVGPTAFRLELPSSIVLGVSISEGNTTTVTTIADYQCGLSIGARRLFHAQLSNGGEFTLDYCLVLNTALRTASQSGASQTWDLWQISLGTNPTVAIHMVGERDSVSLVELSAGG